MIWTPPEGMPGEVVRAWRVFYSGIKVNYGVSPADYRLLYVAQKGRCWICRQSRGKHPDDPKGAGAQRLGVDHNHAMGPVRTAVRGLLCTRGEHSCNRILGHVRDSPERLRRALEMLERPPAQRALVYADHPDAEVLATTVLWGDL